MRINTLVFGVKCYRGKDCLVDWQVYDYGLYVPSGIKYPSELFELEEDVMIKVFEDYEENQWYECSDLPHGHIKDIYDEQWRDENCYIRGGDILKIKDMKDPCYHTDYQLYLELSKHKEALLNYNLMLSVTPSIWWNSTHPLTL